MFNIFRPLAFVCFLIVFGLYSKAQTSNETNFKFTIAPATGPIVVDGKLNEAAWANISEIAPFNQNFPYDTGMAIHQTRVKVTQDKNFL